MQSGRPGIEFTERRGCSNPVERDGEFTVYRPNRQPIPSVRSYIRIDADDLGHAVGHEREQNSIRQRIQLDEIVVVRCSQTHGDAAVPV